MAVSEVAATQRRNTVRINGELRKLIDKNVCQCIEGNSLCSLNTFVLHQHGTFEHGHFLCHHNTYRLRTVLARVSQAQSGSL